MTTIDTLLTRVRRPLRDAAEEFFTDAEMIEYVNEALVDLAVRQRLLQNEDTLVIASGVATVPANVGDTRYLIDPNGELAVNVTEDVFTSYVDAGYNDTTHPIWTIVENQIKVYPVTDGNWTLGFYALPTEITVVGDTFPYTRKWEQKLVHYVRAECWQRLGELDQHAIERAKYDEGLRRPTYESREHVVSLAREPNWADMNPRSIHRG